MRFPFAPPESACASAVTASIVRAVQLLPVELAIFMCPLGTIITGVPDQGNLIYARFFEAATIVATTSSTPGFCKGFSYRAVDEKGT
jgi:hypothetical protein